MYYLSRDPQGRVIADYNRSSPYNTCRCGRQCDTERPNQTVNHCLACDGVIVQVTVNALKNSRQSARLQARIAQEPVPDFTPIDVTNSQGRPASSLDEQLAKIQREGDDRPTQKRRLG